MECNSACPLFQQCWFRKYFSHSFFPYGFLKSLLKVNHNITNFDLKKKKKIRQKEEKNYNPMKHCKLYY